MASPRFRCYLCGEEYCYREGIYTECSKCSKEFDCEKKKNSDNPNKPNDPKDGVCAGCVMSERKKQQSMLPEGV